MNTQTNVNSSSRLFLLKTISLALVTVILLFSACSSCPEPEQQLPDGTYAATVTIADLINIGMPTDNVCENAGTFALTITGKKWSMFQTAATGCIVESPSWSGTWKLCGNEVTFTEDGGDTYIYMWTSIGTSIQFTRVEDYVPHRIVRMVTYPWVLQK